MCIELAQAMDAEGPFGMRKRVSAVAFTPDDEAGFKQALAELMTSSSTIGR